MPTFTTLTEVTFTWYSHVSNCTRRPKFATGLGCTVIQEINSYVKESCETQAKKFSLAWDRNCTLWHNKLRRNISWKPLNNTKWNWKRKNLPTLAPSKFRCLFHPFAHLASCIKSQRNFSCVLPPTSDAFWAARISANNWFSRIRHSLCDSSVCIFCLHCVFWNRRNVKWRAFEF